MLITEQGVRVDPSRQEIRVEGRLVRSQSEVYLLLYKPRGYLCTSSDPRGRPVCLDLLPPSSSRVYTVGRLDMDSEGLLLITNDGELAHRMTHPRFHLGKVYRVWVSHPLPPVAMRRLTGGMVVDGEEMRMDAISRQRPEDGDCSYRVDLHEGKNRQIRRMMRAVGVRVLRIQRVQIGPLRLGTLKPGETRPLTPEERSILYEAVKLAPATGA